MADFPFETGDRTLNTNMQVFALAVLAMMVAEPAHAADDAAAQVLVDRAISAIGGNKALQKTRNNIIDDAGTYYGMGEGVPYEGRYVLVLGDVIRYRMDIAGQFVSVTDGDKAWISAMGAVSDVEGVGLEVARREAFVSYALSLIPLQKPSDAFRLGLAEKEVIEGEECAGITIDHEKMPTATLYFDKNGLIKKTSYRTRAPELGYQEVRYDSIFSDYKVIDGVQTAMKMTMFRDGKKYVESNVKKVTYPESIDESEFKKPE